MSNIVSTYQRFDWEKKIASMNANDAKRWQIAEYQKCAGNKQYWFQQYVCTIDARKTPSIIPFILYDFQIDLINQLDKYGDTFIDKSRQMGISWTIMGWQLHNVLYNKGFTALNISRKESEVQDSGNTHHCLFGRLFFMYSRLPPFLRPRIHNPFLTFKVPSMDSVIKGESSNPKAGRDSQYKFVFIDEAAFIDCLDEMWKGVRSASNSICLCSTPPQSKVNNKFAELREMKNSGFKHMRFHWSMHPEYTPEWYARKTASMQKHEIAQELEIAYDAALTNLSYPEFNDTVHVLDHKVYLNPESKLYCFMDFGLDGEVFLFAQKDRDDRLFFLYYRVFQNMLTPELYNEFLKALGHIGYTGPIKNIGFIGDRSGSRRHRTSKKSVIEEYYDISKGAMDIKYQENLTNEEKMRNFKTFLKRTINGKPQCNLSKEETCLKFAEAIRCIQLNPRKDDHLNTDRYIHVINAAEYGISYLFPRKKAECCIVSLDPGQEIENSEGKKVVVPGPHQKAASAASVVGAYRIQRKGVIF